MIKLFMRKKLIAAAALILAIGGVAAYVVGAGKTGGQGAKAAQGETAQGPPPANVVVAEAIEALLAPRSEAPGSVVGLRDSLVAAETSGKIIWVADVGAEIEQGAAIARIDPKDAQFARDEAAADFGRLKARADFLSRNVKRFVDLGDESGESAASLDQMKAERDEALQNLARARVALDRAETNLLRTEVKAPFAGRLVSQDTQVGEYASPGAPIARLVDTRSLEVTAQAPDSLLKSVKPGDSIEVSLGAERVKATIRAIVPVGDQLTRTMEIRLALPEAQWPIGSAVRVALPQTAPRPVVAAHRDAVILRADRISVYVVGADMTAKQVDVELGAAEGDLIEIIGDVKPGDRVIIRGAERLRDGQKVTIGEARGAAARA
jgi:RND family efflux transporter MFP subunit